MKRPQNGLAYIWLFAILLIIFAAWMFVYVRHHNNTNAVQAGTKSSQTGKTAPATSAKLTTGNSDSDLSADLQNINNGLGQGSQELQSADSALNDQQITIQ